MATMSDCAAARTSESEPLTTSRYVIVSGDGKRILNEFNSFVDFESCLAPRLFPMTSEGALDADFELSRAKLYRDLAREHESPVIRQLDLTLSIQ